MSLPKTQIRTVKVYFREWMKGDCEFSEHVPITTTWEDYLDKRGLGNISHRFFYDTATGRPLTRGATLEAMGYRGGKLTVSYR
jgi:hypothetical protein